MAVQVDTGREAFSTKLRKAQAARRHLLSIRESERLLRIARSGVGDLQEPIIKRIGRGLSCLKYVVLYPDGSAVVSRETERGTVVSYFNATGEHEKSTFI